AADDQPVKRVLGVERRALRMRTVAALAVGLVVREVRTSVPRTVEPPLAELILERQVRQAIGAAIVGEERNGSAAAGARRLDDDRRRRLTPASPAPRVAKPEMRDDVQGRRIGAAVERLDAYADVLGTVLRVLDEDVEISIAVENSGVEQLELEAAAAARGSLVEEPLIGAGGLRRLVEHPHVAACRGAV